MVGYALVAKILLGTHTLYKSLIVCSSENLHHFGNRDMFIVELYILRKGQLHISHT